MTTGICITCFEHDLIVSGGQCTSCIDGESTGESEVVVVKPVLRNYADWINALADGLEQSGPIG